MNKIIISAPFGNYLNFPNTTSTLGTFTLYGNGGFLYRCWRVLRTVRYSWRSKAWINKLGLPNPGIGSLLEKYIGDKIVSIHGLNKQEWDRILWTILANSSINTIELNLSCPNVNHKPNIKEVEETIHMSRENKLTIIAKLPPIRWMEYAIPLHQLGVRCFHCCNTIPTPGGGLSGKPLMPYSLWAIEELRQRFGQDVNLTGGGGITCMEDIDRYRQAGADRFAVGSMLFNPFNWRKIKYMALEK